MTKESNVKFYPADFRWTAQLLRSKNEEVVKSSLSNNLNIILAALDKCANDLGTNNLEPIDKPNLISGYLETPIRADQETIVLIDHGDK